MIPWVADGTMAIPDNNVIYTLIPTSAFILIRCMSHTIVICFEVTGNTNGAWYEGHKIEPHVPGGQYVDLPDQRSRINTVERKKKRKYMSFVHTPFQVAWNDMYVLAYQYLSRLRGYFSHIPDHTTTEETRRRFQTEAREIHDLQQIQWEVATQRMSLQTRRTWNNNSRVYPITESVRNRSNEPAWRPIHQQAQWYQSGQST